MTAKVELDKIRKFESLKLRDLVIINTNKGRKLLRVNSIKDFHPASGIPFTHFQIDTSPDWGAGFYTFDDKDFIKSFGGISIEEFNTQYPEYTF